MKKFLTKESFLQQREKFQNKDDVHWKTSIERWEYHEKTIDIVKELNHSKILEAGTMGIQICEQSDSIDLNLPESFWPLHYNPTYNHDLRKIPWPIEDKFYDVFIALRVFQYFIDTPKICLEESFRIANTIILALPEKYTSIYKGIKLPSIELSMKSSDTVILVYK